MEDVEYKLFGWEPSVINIMENLLLYSNRNKLFNREFIDSVYDFLKRHDYITLKQMRVLRNICDENKVDEFLENMEY